MATKDALDQLNEALERLSAVDMEAVKRPDLGDESLSPDLEGWEVEINRIADYAKRFARHVYDDTVRQMVYNIRSITNVLDAQAKLGPDEYIQNRAPFLNSLRMHIERANDWKLVVVSAAIIERGFLDDDGIKREAERTLARIRTEAQQILSEAEAKADEIKGRARLTAEGVSVREAQKQFREAAAHDKNQVILWACLAGVAVVVLICTAVALLKSITVPEDPEWYQSMAPTLLKVFILSALAGIATFTFRVFRAHLHIAEKNRHRVRVANSIESFLQSTRDSSQRDLILAKLADSIVNYGDSGLVQHEREDHSATMSGDLMGRIVAAISGKGG